MCCNHKHLHALTMAHRQAAGKKRKLESAQQLPEIQGIPMQVLPLHIQAIKVTTEFIRHSSEVVVIPDEAEVKAPAGSLLEDSLNWFVLYPIKDAKIFKYYKQQTTCFWTPQDINLSHDQVDWDTLTRNEQWFIATTPAFFAALDRIANENLLENIMPAVKLPEA
jgi:hypothetical protein